jgi:CMP-N-acetylneuraminic acid synthetase
VETRVLEDFTFIIPAREGSKGLPHKNRALMDYTLSSMPSDIKAKIIIATDDEYIKDKYSDYRIYERTKESSVDTASTKYLMQEIIDNVETNNIILLYLTYPERTFREILSAVEFYKKHDAYSLLCSKSLSITPFLMLYENGINGEQVIKHDLYRRQDYRKCFELSHYVCIFDKRAINKLNNNLYNKDTVYYPIHSVIDVDTKNDMEKYLEKN